MDVDIVVNDDEPMDLDVVERDDDMNLDDIEHDDDMNVDDVLMDVDLDASVRRSVFYLIPLIIAVGVEQSSLKVFG